jgi:hypothetical protein
MINLVLITSVIHTPNSPLSYTNTRSIYSVQKRYDQTKKTIQSIKDKIPDAIIVIVECSELSESEEEFLTQNCYKLINLYKFKHIRDNVYGISKSLGEGSLTYYALNYIQLSNIKYDNLIKISGRYMLSNNFNLNNFNNDSIVIKYIDGDCNNVITSLYKIPHKLVENFKTFLNNNFNLMAQCIGYEVLFSMFVNSITDIDIKSLDPIGVEGGIAVSTDYYNG